MRKAEARPRPKVRPRSAVSSRRTVGATSPGNETLSRRVFLRLAGTAAATAALGLPLLRPPAVQAQASRSSATYRAVLVVSLSKDKVERIKARERERKLTQELRSASAGRMARLLRDLRGVRHVEAVIFRDWREEGRRGQDPAFEPVGALVIVEAPGPERLQRRIDQIWEVAKRLDQRGLEMSAVDNWG